MPDSTGDITTTPPRRSATPASAASDAHETRPARVCGSRRNGRVPDKPNRPRYRYRPRPRKKNMTANNAVEATEYRRLTADVRQSSAPREWRPGCHAGWLNWADSRCRTSDRWPCDLAERTVRKRPRTADACRPALRFRPPARGRAMTGCCSTVGPAGFGVACSACAKSPFCVSTPVLLSDGKVITYCAAKRYNYF